MNTLLLDRKDMTISQERKTLKVSIEGNKPKTIPFAQIKRIVVSSNIKLESRLLRTLATEDISLVLINPRKPEEYGLLIGSGHNDASRRIDQMKASENDQLCQRYARYLVTEKIQGQKQLIDEIVKNRPQHRYHLSKASQTLGHSLKRLQTEALNLNSIRGIEGSSAAAYFSAFTHVCPAGLSFTHRNRRPPRDPVNALLSLSYTLANSLAGYRLQIHGYDLLIGFYHKLSYSRHSLSSDIIEPVRPLIDAWVLRQVNDKYLRKEHFKEQNEGCYLSKTGRERYYAAWEFEMKGPVIDRIEAAIGELENLLGHKDAD